jgi:hypothetical protein
MLNGMRYMHFGTDNNTTESDKMIKFPIEVTSMINSFSASTTRGYAVLQRIFTRNENDTFNVTSLDNCFDGSSGAT